MVKCCDLARTKLRIPFYCISIIKIKFPLLCFGDLNFKSVVAFLPCYINEPFTEKRKENKMMFDTMFKPKMINRYCESTFIHWHKFLWFLQNALIPGLLNSWFQRLQATINGKIVICCILNHKIHEKLEPHD